MKAKPFLLCFVPILIGCTQNAETEIYQSRRDNVINVHDRIHPIDLGDIYTNRWSQPLVADDYLIIADGKALDEAINVFDLNTFNHVTSFGNMGPGPNEITGMGQVNWIGNTRELYVSDLGKMQIVSYVLDSVLNNTQYPPVERFRLNGAKLPFNNVFFNDTVSYSKMMIPTDDGSFNNMTGVVNHTTSEVDIKIYDRPEFFKKRFCLAVSPDDSIYAECNFILDLVCIFSLDGRLIRNVYGPQWGVDDLQCFTGAIFTKEHLFASYDGLDYEKYALPTRCEVFTKHGDYVATIDIGYNITALCHDAKHDRIIFAFDDEIEYGYLDLNDIGLK